MPPPPFSAYPQEKQAYDGPLANQRSIRFRLLIARSTTLLGRDLPAGPPFYWFYESSGMGDMKPLMTKRILDALSPGHKPPLTENGRSVCSDIRLS